LKVLLLSRYGPLGASSRVRFYQYLPGLRSRGVDVAVAPLLPDDYLSALYAGRPTPWRTIVAAGGRRISTLLRSQRFDVLWIEGEALPWWPYGIERLVRSGSVPTVVEYDDAIFHRYDRHRVHLVRRILGRKIDDMMRDAGTVIAGNEYIAARARAAGSRRVEILPSAVDPERYRPVRPVDSPGCRIGWIGSPTTSPYLEPLRGVLQRLSRSGPVEITLIGAPPGTLADAGASVRPWRDGDEVAALNAFDIGVMPVPDGPFERGKCGFKVVQYMACGRAVVASPVGANRQIVEHGVNGILASTDDEWEVALRRLAGNPDMRRSLAEAGRRTVLGSYSTTVVLPKLVGILRDAAGMCR
jgi:glycosyltransferase involved in cell wall biosynthesis